MTVQHGDLGRSELVLVNENDIEVDDATGTALVQSAEFSCCSTDGTLTECSHGGGGGIRMNPDGEDGARTIFGRTWRRRHFQTDPCARLAQLPTAACCCYRSLPSRQPSPEVSESTTSGELRRLHGHRVPDVNDADVDPSAHTPILLSSKTAAAAGLAAGMTCFPAETLRSDSVLVTSSPNADPVADQELTPETVESGTGMAESVLAAGVGYRLGLRNVLSERRKRVADYSLACALFGLAVVVAETEMSMADMYDKESLYSHALKSVVTLSTVILLGLIITYHGLQAQLFVVDNCVDDWRIALSFRGVLLIGAELLVCSVHPAPGSYHFRWMSSNSRSSSAVRHRLDDRILNYHHHQLLQSASDVVDPHPDVSDTGGTFQTYLDSVDIDEDEGPAAVARVPFDVLLSLPMFLRLYLVGRVLLLHSRLFSDASSRSIGALNRINFNTRFVLKTLMTICPGTVLIVVVLSLWIVASWILRACESHHDVKHRNLLNSMWMIAITFLSVGYGDIVPNTYCGRAIAVWSGIMGSGCTALVVAVFARKMELTRAEKHVHNFMMDNQLTKRFTELLWLQLKSTAANVLRETWFIYKYTRLVGKPNVSKIRTHQRKFLQAIHSMRQIKMDLRKLSDTANTFVDMAKQFIHSPLDSTPSAYSSQPPAVYRQTQTNLLEAVVEMNSRQLVVERRTDKIENTLRHLQAHLEALPSLVLERLAVDKQRHLPTT